eukprot:SAG11_NODE_53888_length_102_cov_97.000000_1_plen_34_part_11
MHPSADEVSARPRDLRCSARVDGSVPADVQIAPD